jgi:hypothetical protein
MSILVVDGETFQNLLSSTALVENTDNAKRFWCLQVGYAKGVTKTKTAAIEAGKEHWPDKCCAKGCKNAAVHGGHVKHQDGFGSGRWYILPTCQKIHNLGATTTLICPTKGTLAVEESRGKVGKKLKTWFKNVFAQAQAANTS